MNILAIGAHPDDIEYGCGGTLIKYVSAGHTVHLHIVTDGSYGSDPAIRRAEQEDAAAYIGAKGLSWGHRRDTEVVDDRALIVSIEEAVQKARPDAVFVNYYEDTHQDHRAVSLAAASATRYVKEVLFFEVPTSSNFNPEIFVDIESVLPKKMELLGMHASQVNKTKVQNLTILESARSCANFRGFQGRVKFAEAFKPLRVLRDIARC